MFSILKSDDNMFSWFRKKCSEESFRNKYITTEVSLCAMQFLHNNDTITSLYKSIQSLPNIFHELIQDYRNE